MLIIGLKQFLYKYIQIYLSVEQEKNEESFPAENQKDEIKKEQPEPVRSDSDLRNIFMFI